MKIQVAPSTFHTLKFIKDNPGCTSGEFCSHYGQDLGHIRSPYYSNMLSSNLLGSLPHPRSPAGRTIESVKKFWKIANDPNAHPAYRSRSEGYSTVTETLEWGSQRRNWIYRNKPEDSKVFRYWLTAKALEIIDNLECNRSGQQFPHRRDLCELCKYNYS